MSERRLRGKELDQNIRQLAGGLFRNEVSAGQGACAEAGRPGAPYLGGVGKLAFGFAGDDEDGTFDSAT